MLAVTFDLGRLEVTGSPNTVIENTVTHPAAHYRVSDNGTLRYTPGGAEAGKNNTLVSVDTQGAKNRWSGLQLRAAVSVFLQTASNLPCR